MRTLINLEEILQDSPQSRALVGLMEEDAGHLRYWSYNLRSALNDIVSAQDALVAAFGTLTAVLSSFQHQTLPLDDLTLDTPRTFGTLAEISAEIGTWLEVVAEQVRHGSYGPVKRLSSELHHVCEVDKLDFHDSRKRLDEVENRFAKASPNDPQRKIDELNDDVFLAKRQYHEQALSYFSSLNDLQFKRYTLTIEPLLTLFYAWRSCVSNGCDYLKSEKLTDKLTQAQGQMQIIHQDQKLDRSKRAALGRTLDEVRKLDKNMYYAEPPVHDGGGGETGAGGAGDGAGADGGAVIQLHLTDPDALQKQGLVWIRGKGVFFTHPWDRYFLFTQGTKLMKQTDTQLVGEEWIDLSQQLVPTASGDDVVVTTANNNNSHSRAELVPSTERRFVFAIHNLKPPLPSGDPVLVQAKNSEDCLQWVTVINNLLNGAAGTPDSAAPTPPSSSPKTKSPPRPPPPKQHGSGGTGGSPSKPSPAATGAPDAQVTAAATADAVKDKPSVSVSPPADVPAADAPPAEAPTAVVAAPEAANDLALDRPIQFHLQNSGELVTLSEGAKKFEVRFLGCTSLPSSATKSANSEKLAELSQLSIARVVSERQDGTDSSDLTTTTTTTVNTVPQLYQLIFDRNNKIAGLFDCDSEVAKVKLEAGDIIHCERVEGGHDAQPAPLAIVTRKRDADADSLYVVEPTASGDAKVISELCKEFSEILS